MATAANKLQTGGLSYGRFAHWQMSLHLSKALLAAAEADQSLGLVGAELEWLVSKPSVQMSLMACLLHPAAVLASRCSQSLCSAIRQSPSPSAGAAGRAALSQQTPACPTPDSYRRVQAAPFHFSRAHAIPKGKTGSFESKASAAHVLVQMRKALWR